MAPVLFEALRRRTPCSTGTLFPTPSVPLYGRSVAGTSGARTTRPPPSSNVDEFAISSDSRYTVYIADQEADGVDELFLAGYDSQTPPTAFKSQIPMLFRSSDRFD